MTVKLIEASFSSYCYLLIDFREKSSKAAVHTTSQLRLYDAKYQCGHLQLFVEMATLDSLFCSPDVWQAHGLRHLLSPMWEECIRYALIVDGPYCII